MSPWKTLHPDLVCVISKFSHLYRPGTSVNVIYRHCNNAIWPPIRTTTTTTSHSAALMRFQAHKRSYSHVFHGPHYIQILTICSPGCVADLRANIVPCLDLRQFSVSTKPVPTGRPSRDSPVQSCLEFAVSTGVGDDCQFEPEISSNPLTNDRRAHLCTCFAGSTCLAHYVLHWT